MTLRMTSLLSSGALGAALLLAPPLFAQTSTAQKATAEAYFDDALRAMKTGQYAEACAKLEASQRLDPAVGTLLYLGECYEKRGRTASAWVTFRDAEALARSAGQPQRAEMARVHAERLQAGLSRITVEISPEARATAGLQIRCGSVPIDPSLPGAAVPVDPGEVIVEASAPGYAALSRSVTVAPGSKVSVTIPALTRLTTPAAGAPPAEAPTSSPPAPSPASAPSPGPTAPAAGPVQELPPPETQSLVLPLTLGAIGLVGIGVGSVFGVKSIENAGDARDSCPGGACREERGETLMNRARTQANVSNVAFAVGAAGVAAGIIVYVLGRPKQAEAGLDIAPWVSQSQAGLSLEGRL